MSGEKQRLEEHRQRVEAWLRDCFREREPRGDLYDAMRYSLLAGGKRIRPVLLLECCRICGGDPQAALPFAGAVEMIHTYSLIHDDLPCMDDDDLRRGRPTCHRVYGETMAVLAGDALQPEAFAILAAAPGLTDAQRVDAVAVLARAAGADGMVAGQVLDLEGKCCSREQVESLHRLKTGAMIEAAAELGCVAAGASPEQRKAARDYAGSAGEGELASALDELWNALIFDGEHLPGQEAVLAQALRDQDPAAITASASALRSSPQ